MELNKEQLLAVEAIKEWAEGKGPAMISLTGFAGSGKSTLTKEIKKYIPTAAFTALTGRAALRLSEVADVKATTLHSVLYKQPDQLKNGELEFNTLNAPSFKFLAIDESSMITIKIFDDLKKWVQFYKIRILFIGDSFQLPPVLTEAEKKIDNEFTVFSYVKGPELTQIMRSNDGIINAATIIREEKRIPTIDTASYSLVQTIDPLEYTINQYLADPDDHMIITWRNKMRMEGNHRIRKRLGHKSYLPDDGEPIIFCRNGQSVLNGQIEIVKNMSPGPIIEGIITYKVELTDKRVILCSVSGKDEQMDGQLFIKNWKSYLKTRRKLDVPDPIPITYGFFSTCHKMQGNQCRRISIVLEGHDINNINFRAQTTLPNGKNVPFGIRMLYTALTRAKEKASLIIGE